MPARRGSWSTQSRAIRQRAFYYTHVFADPENKDVVYMQNTSLFRSTDGGKTHVQVGQNTHGDHHDLWIDPDDPTHLVDGNDGGGAVIRHQHAVPNWSAQDFPTAQWYHVITTKHLPYHVCGSQQDNSTLCVPSNTNAPAAAASAASRRSRRIRPAAASPATSRPIATDPDIFFGGTNNGWFLTRFNRRTGEFKEVGAVSALLLGRAGDATSRSAGSGRIRSSSRTSIRTCSTPARSASGRPPTAATPGRRSAAT